jgi:hypothetical protein
MATKANPRFDALEVGRLASVGAGQRFEIELLGPDGTTLLVSVPMVSAVQLGCRICDLAEKAPYLVGGVTRRAAAARSS